MNLPSLLNLSLKSDELIELFELYEVEVVYAYDRLYEGTEDKYYGSIYDLGLEFSFDHEQILKTIFVFMNTTEEYQAASLSKLGIDEFSDKPSLLEHVKSNNLEFQEGEAEFLGEYRKWVKVIFDGHSIHYEYLKSGLSQVTFQA
ncbi:hypothetical protein [Corallincola spongiicola]|uniref:DUF4375 domain-containing protein n=1 Tax=Corallincola spongiicola TaxID=2520508 RepID=A0ABY1WM82_9GAMM|nr:hypothetical protein [Corallincola spongiicola]TAA42705.1 hypothetical protein EXY25_15580 [Corallincola spongiicola]